VGARRRASEHQAPEILEVIVGSRALLAWSGAVLCLRCAGAPEEEVEAKETPSEDISIDEPLPGDRSLLPLSPDRPLGAYGFSRYYYTEVDGEITPLLLEGPSGKQVRCQEDALPCSYLELKKLHESGAPIPKELEISREELATLVQQLDTVSAALARFKTIHDACAAGYRPNTGQAHNMGIHMGLSSHHGAEKSEEFDPAVPNTLLFAMKGGELLNRDEQGRCDGDRWVGPDGYRIVGAVFKVPPTPEHPEGFAGPFDNWHVHFNACGNPLHQNDGSLQGSRSRCEADGGVFVEEAGNWMIHAYVVPEFDNPAGVFAMFNPTIWPLAPAIDDPLGPDANEGDAVKAPIVDFSFGSIEARVNQTVYFQNQDPFAHSVVSGDPGNETGAFDSGPLGQGQAFPVTYDRPGEHRVFCRIHPSEMRATVIVR
jgi:plastocyanin